MINLSVCFWRVLREKNQVNKAVINIGKACIVWVLFFCVTGVQAQIIDDSTKLVYGPHSTTFTFEQKIRENDTSFQRVDTTLYNLENFEVIKSEQVYYQDLGLNGTAMKPMYFNTSRNIGRTSGFSAYDPYMTTPEEFKYYDTKSPFMDLNVAFGGNGRSKVDFNFSRNVKPNWNVGFDIYRLNSNRQIGELALTGNNTQVKSSTLDIYTYYVSDKQDYTLLFHALRFEHEAVENGGAAVDLGAEELEFFQYADTPVRLQSAQSKDTRVNLHLYHEYSLKPFFEIYHVLDKSSNRHEFNDFSLDNDKDYFENIYIRTDSTLDATVFNEVKNEVGIKGKLSNTLFYSAYLKRRDINHRYVYSKPYGHVGENYLGGDVKVFVGSNEVGGNLELLDGGQYYLRGYLHNKYVKAVYTSAIYNPSFLSEQYLGNHYEWSNDFDPIIVNSIEGSAKYDFSFLSIEPKVSITSVNEYVYFGTDKQPAQSSATAIINKYGVRADFTLGKYFRLHNDINYNILAGDGADVFRIPDLMINSRWYYESVWFNNYMPVQFGFNARWQSAYYGHAYDPITQQYYLQNDFEMKSYAAVDLFINFQAQKLRIFAKMTHINQAADNGYFASPYYPGQKKVFDIGCRWLFFD